MSFMLDSSGMLVLYGDLLALSVEIALALTCTRGHAHNVPFELSTLIGQFLNSWRMTFQKHLIWSI